MSKYTQEYIAKVCGTSQGSVSNWLALRTRPTGLSKVALQTHFPKIYQEIKGKWQKKNLK